MPWVDVLPVANCRYYELDINGQNRTVTATSDAALHVFGDGVQTVRCLDAGTYTCFHLDFGGHKDRPAHGVAIHSTIWTDVSLFDVLQRIRATAGDPFAPRRRGGNPADGERDGADRPITRG